MKTIAINRTTRREEAEKLVSKLRAADLGNRFNFLACPDGGEMVVTASHRILDESHANEMLIGIMADAVTA